MKKIKKAGENISLKTKKNEDPAIMEWINGQSNLMDSIRYLIENEIHQNGIRNLQQFIPAQRSFNLSASGSPSGARPVSAAQIAAAAETPHPAVQPPVPAEEDDIDDEDIESWT
jgi:hypothetical protein